MGAFSGPEINEDRLVLLLDAGNLKSYPGSGGNTWYDLVGSNNGSISGATHTGDGYFNFDGNNDLVSIPNNPAFHFGSGDFTVEIWAYFTSLVSWTSVYATRNSSTSFSPLVITANGINLLVYASSSCSSWDVINESSFGAISTNTWYQIVLTRSSSTFTKYLNAVSKGTITSSSSLCANNSVLAIGESVNSMAGRISNVRIYKGKALSAAEIQQNYNALRARH